MIASVHLAATGTRRGLRAYFRGAPDPAAVAGLTYAETVLTAPLSSAVLPKPTFAEVGLIAELGGRRAPRPLPRRPGARGALRLRLARADAPAPRLRRLARDAGPAGQALPVDDDEPVVVLTLGRPRITEAPHLPPHQRPRRGRPRRRPGLLASTGLAHPPRLVSTFSVWETAAAMRAYAQDAAGAHMAAVRGDRATPFHHESAFVRFRPYFSRHLALRLRSGRRSPLARPAATQKRSATRRQPRRPHVASGVGLVDDQDGALEVGDGGGGDGAGEVAEQAAALVGADHDQAAFVLVGDLDEALPGGGGLDRRGRWP